MISIVEKHFLHLKLRQGIYNALHENLFLIPNRELVGVRKAIPTDGKNPTLQVDDTLLVNIL